MHALRPVADAVAHALQRPGAGREEVQAAKAKAARELGIPVPPDRDVLTLLDAPLRERHASVLRSKPQRSASGVAIVAVMTSPAACPHGKCTFCPGGPEVGVPQSYTGFEPSTMRAAQLAYDPYRIVRTRLAQLERNGHAVDKVDVILQGGTFPAREPAYQSWCVAMVLAGLRDGPGADGEAGEAPVAERAWAALEDAEQRRRLALALQDNEGAPCRMVGLTVETKPDWCLEPHVDRMLEQGVTRVEVGLQTLDEATLQATHRGHTLAESRRCLQVARDAGLKVCVHMMPGLPRDRAAGTVGAWGGDLDPDPEADLDEMRRLFTEPAWRPDMLKVYPCLVVQEGETLLKRQWREGRFHPLGAQDAAALVGRMKDHVPEWCRIQRVDRDIPTTHVEAGVLQSN
ncbi:MAG TPA: tRNA uridine(34) 5-carboxymethylaminomethyl modification radical SAM/GNAT enzyme Elp3, partial [Candidatus Thermoplasmatota archaeon]|nr:tRNA uridine(34) 5-carboxymethylaminomethyl modification radical SAM/GNAT enzyme Elp3 [Candidatus Thermoplasmatota archaeon]